MHCRILSRSLLLCLALAVLVFHAPSLTAAAEADRWDRVTVPEVLRVGDVSAVPLTFTVNALGGINLTRPQPGAYRVDLKGRWVAATLYATAAATDAGDITLPAAPRLLDGVVYVPTALFFSLGVSVAWQAETGVLTLSLPGEDKQAALREGNTRQLPYDDQLLVPLLPPGEDIPAGFTDGTITGRAYFTRLVYNGAWNAYRAGNRRFLHFLEQAVPCERECRCVTLTDLKRVYLPTGKIPPFLYVYVDEGFTLTDEEAAILKDYVDRGGFLFFDSRPDPAVKAVLVAACARIFPAETLTPIPAKHPLTTYLYALPAPGIGINFLEKKNFGIFRGERLAAFYTMGNFFSLFSGHLPTENDYVSAQYRMIANVVLYALTKGDAEKKGQYVRDTK